jgi:cobalt-zinc-cadmium resistance protein CzcA
VIEAIVRGSIHHRRAVIGAWTVLTLAALSLSVRLDLDALPDITSNQVQVLTRAPGLTPEEVELRVTRPIEVALGGLPGLDHHRSLSRFGLSAVTVVFDDATDRYRARQLVSERVAMAAGALPVGVDAPELGPMTGGLGEVFHFTVESPGRTPAELLELAEQRVVPILRAAEGVVEVNTWGGARRTLEVRADPARMAPLGVTLAALRETIAQAVTTVPGGALPLGETQVLLRGARPTTTPSDVGNLSVATARGEPVRVADVADVGLGALPRIGAATADGRGETVYVMVQMLSGANARDVTARIRARMPEVRRVLPDDVVIRMVYDRAELVDATLRTVGKNLLEGGLLVTLILLLTLGSLRAGLLVAASIPVAMALATAAMVLLHIPGNLMSLGALDFGLLVDGAVVLIENVFHRTPGDTRAWADRVEDACVRVARPSYYGVLIILLVYVPVLSLAGVDGKLFRPMALTVVLALVAALVFTLTFVPAAAAAWLRERDLPQGTPRVVQLIERVHTALLGRAVARPGVVLGLALGSLVAAGVAYTHAGTELAPELDEGDLVIQTTRRPDLSLDGAVRAAGHMERTVRAAAPEVLQIVSRVGSPAVATDTMGLEQADVFVHLAPRSQWRPGLTRDALIAQLEAALEQSDPGGDPAFTQPIQMRFNELLAGAPMDVVVSVYGQDLAALRAVAEQLTGTVAGVRGVEDARVLAPEDVPLAEVRPLEGRARAHGLTVTDVLAHVQAARLGVVAATTYDGPRALPVVLTLGGPGRTPLDLGELPLPTAQGALVPLSALAEVDERSTPSSITHHQGERRLLVGFNVRGRDLGETVAEAEHLAAATPLPSGVRLGWSGQYEALTEARERLALVVPAVIALILVVLAWLFREARPVLIVASHIPFACVGGMAALAARGLPISISAAIGFIAVSGIAVMNGVVLMNDVLTRRARGDDFGEAALGAAQARVRPVSMTAMVAALGFLPMMLATGVGAEVQRPLATVVVGGLVSSTTLTLLVLPAVYAWLGGSRRARASVAAPQEVHA